jgi:formylglycine-generating enzyme required for sulfatase activity
MLGGLLAAVGNTRAAELWTNTLHMKFVRVPAGEFAMGSPLSEPERFTNETPHRVKITRPFWLGTTHVTVAQFAAFVSDSGYRTVAEKEGWAYGAWNDPEKKWDRLDGASWKNPGFAQDTSHPVVSVNWHDASAFCRWLSVKENRAYRLPTEAQWEYACRAGADTAYPWGNRADDGKGWANGLDQTAARQFTLFPPFTWSDGFLHTSPAGTFRPNAWGLQDMIGNTLQWCEDWFADYPAAPVQDPRGPTEGKERVLRGGAFLYGPRHCRCAFRGRNSPDFRNFYIGFRVVVEREPDGGPS